MPIRIDRFGGMIPKMDPTALPDNAAALAVNCDVSGGVLVPSSTPSPMFSLRNSDGTFVGDVDATASSFTTKPTKPALLSSDFIRPLDIEDEGVSIANWLQIYAYWCVTYSPTDTQAPDRGVPTIFPMSRWWFNSVLCNWTWAYTVSGLVLQVTHSGFSNKQFSGEFEWKVWGPIYKFKFIPDINGGPKVAHEFPNQVFYYTPQYPSPRVPLYYNNNLYGEFQVTSAEGSNWNYTFDTTYYLQNLNTLDGGKTTFRINLNYVNPIERTFFYVTTPVDIVDQSDPDAYREGIPSDISNEIKLPPGVIHKITSTNTDTKPMNIYRSETGGDDFRMVAEKVSHTELAAGWEDNERIAVGDPIPPFGARPTGLETDEMYWHPAGFAVGYRNLADNTGELWRSDLYREWAWPEENTLPFPEKIQCIVMSGNAVLVFTTSYVYAVVGNDPERGTRVLLSSSLPLINRNSVCRIGANVYYSTHDGLAVVNGSECKLISGGHFDRELWLDLGMGAAQSGVTAPEIDGVRYYARRDLSALLEDYSGTEIEAKVADGKIFFGPLTFDLEEELAAVTTNDTSGTSSWKSKMFVFEQPVTFDYVELVSEGTVTGTVYADDVAVGTVTNVIEQDDDVSVTTDAWLPVTYTTTGPKSVWAKRWQIDITFDSIVRRMSIADRQVIDAGDDVVLTPEQVPCWKDVWLRFPNRGNFCAGTVKHQGGDAIPVYFTPGDDMVVPATEATSRVAGSATDKGLFYLPRTMTKSPYWHVKVDYAHRIDQLMLFRRRTEALDGYQIREVNHGDVPPWRIKRYEFDGKGWPSAIEVHFDSTHGAIPVNLYKDGSATADPASTTVLPGNAIRLDGMGAVDSLEFDFGTYDDIVDEVIVYADPAQLVGDEGVLLSDAKRFTGLNYKFPDRGRWAIYSVWAENYDSVTLNLYPDGSTTPDSYTVTDAKCHYIPYTANEYPTWEASVSTTAQVRQLMLIPWTRQQVEGNTISITARDTAFPPWRHTIWQFPKSKTLRSIWVDAEDLTDELSMYLYPDGAVTPLKFRLYPNFDYSLRNLGFPTPVESLRITFDAADEHLVNHVRVHAVETVQAGPEGAVLQDPPTWRMNHVQMPGSTQWACAVTRADDYANLKVSIIKGGKVGDQAVETLSPTDGDAVAVNRGAGESNEWVVDVYRTTQTTPRHAEPDYLRLVPWVEVPVEGGVIRSVKTDPNLPPWLFQRYVFTNRQKLNTVLVNASSSVTMTLYLDGSATGEDAITITPGVEYVLPTTLSRCQRVDFAFSDDSAVREVFVFTEQEAIVGDQGVSLTNPINTRMIPVKFAGTAAWACGMIGADYSSDQTVTLKLYRDMAGARTLVHTQTVNNGDPFRIQDSNGDPVMTSDSRWWIDVDGVDIRSILLLPWSRQQMQEGIDVIRPQTGIPPWFYTIWESEKRVQFTSWEIQSDNESSISLSLFSDKTEYTQTVLSGNVSEQLFTSTIGYGNEFYLHFSGDDLDVRSLHLYPQTVIPIEQNGIILRQGENVRSWRKVRLAFPDVGSFVVARVVCDGEVSMTLWCDGTEQNTWTRNTKVKQRREFSLMKESGDGDERESTDMLDSGRHWDLDITADKPVREVHLIGNTVTPVGNGSVTIRKQEQPFTWLRQRVVSETPIQYNCARVISEVYPVAIRLYAGYNRSTDYPELAENNGATDIKAGRGEYSVIKVIQDSRPVHLPKTDPDGNYATPTTVWTFDVVDWDNVNQFEDTYDASVGRPKYDAIIHEVSLATSMERLKR